MSADDCKRLFSVSIEDLSKVAESRSFNCMETLDSVSSFLNAVGLDSTGRVTPTFASKIGGGLDNFAHERRRTEAIKHFGVNTIPVHSGSFLSVLIESSRDCYVLFIAGFLSLLLGFHRESSFYEGIFIILAALIVVFLGACAQFCLQRRLYTVLNSTQSKVTIQRPVDSEQKCSDNSNKTFNMSGYLLDSSALINCESKGHDKSHRTNNGLGQLLDRECSDDTNTNQTFNVSGYLQNSPSLANCESEGPNKFERTNNGPNCSPDSTNHPSKGSLYKKPNNVCYSTLNLKSIHLNDDSAHHASSPSNEDLDHKISDEYLKYEPYNQNSAVDKSFFVQIDDLKESQLYAKKSSNKRLSIDSWDMKTRNPQKSIFDNKHSENRESSNKLKHETSGIQASFESSRDLGNYKFEDRGQRVDYRLKPNKKYKLRLDTISADLLTVGDFLAVRSGDCLPADCLLVSGGPLYMDMRISTGEAVSTVNSLNPFLPGGCVISKGKAMVVVMAVGKLSTKGRLLTAIGAPRVASSLEVAASALSRKLGKQAAVLACILFLILCTVNGFSLWIDKPFTLKNPLKNSDSETLASSPNQNVYGSTNRNISRQIVAGNSFPRSSLGNSNDILMQNGNTSNRHTQNALNINENEQSTLYTNRPNGQKIIAKIFEICLAAAVQAISIAVAAVPEGLPLAVMAALGLAGRRMLSEGLEVREFGASEEMHRVTVVGTDKTGTLTTGKMKVARIFTNEDSVIGYGLNLKDKTDVGQPLNTTQTYSEDNNIDRINFETIETGQKKLVNLESVQRSQPKEIKSKSTDLYSFQLKPTGKIVNKIDYIDYENQLESIDPDLDYGHSNFEVINDNMDNIDRLPNTNSLVSSNQNFYNQILLLVTAAINSSAFIDSNGKIIGSITEGAILKMLTEIGIDWEKIRESADILLEKMFDSDDKYSGVIAKYTPQLIKEIHTASKILFKLKKKTNNFKGTSIENDQETRYGDLFTQQPLNLNKQVTGLECNLSEDSKNYTTFLEDSLLFNSNLDNRDRCLVLFKGAPEIILESCSHVYLSGKNQKINIGKIKKFLKRCDDNFERTLAFAYNFKNKMNPKALDIKSEKNNTFLGVISLIDPLRENVHLEIHQCRKSGIIVTMLTGDKPEMAIQLSQKLGIVRKNYLYVSAPTKNTNKHHYMKNLSDNIAFSNKSIQDTSSLVQKTHNVQEKTNESDFHDNLLECKGYKITNPAQTVFLDDLLSDDVNQYELCMNGEVFREMDPHILDKIVQKIRVIARASPFDKQKYVELMQNAGYVVAITGDGTNDAAALKTADVGFAMGRSGTEIAKMASSIIIKNDEFAAITRSIKWGHCINLSVRKFIQFQLSITYSLITVASISSIFNTTDKELLTPILMLWINAIMDTLAVIALSTDTPQKDDKTQRVPEPKNSSIITKNMKIFIATSSIYQTMATLIMYYATELDNTFILNAYVYMLTANLINARSISPEQSPFLFVTKNKLLWIVILVIILTQLFITQKLNIIFKTTQLDLKSFLFSSAIGLSIIPYSEIIRIITKNFNKAQQMKKTESGHL